MPQKTSKTRCPKCHGSGALSYNGQVNACGQCGGAGSVSRQEISPFDYVFEYTIGAAGTASISVQILSYDFLLKWLVAYTATPTDKLQVQDNNQLYWSNAPLQLQNFAGSAQLPFPVQPNVVLEKNTILTINLTGTNGDTGEIVFRGINLSDQPAAATSSSS